MLPTIFSAGVGIVIAAAGAAVLCFVGWSLKTGVTYYGGPPIRRVEYSQSRTTFWWALAGDLIFGILLLYIGVGVLRLTLRS
jgi:hypothetical protein